MEFERELVDEVLCLGWYKIVLQIRFGKRPTRILAARRCAEVSALRLAAIGWGDTMQKSHDHVRAQLHAELLSESESTRVGFCTAKS